MIVLITSLIQKGYWIEFSPGDDGIDENGDPFTFHVQLNADGRIIHGEYTHDPEAVLKSWQSFKGSGLPPTALAPEMITTS